MATLGIDYANTDTINAPGVEGFKKAKAAGAKIIIPRAVYGEPAYGQSPVFVDGYWARDKQAILDAGLISSAYLFVCVKRLGKNGATITPPSPRVQAEAFIAQAGCDLVKPTLGQRNFNMVPFFDVEQDSTLITPDEYYQQILEVARILREHFGAWPGMYTSARVWHEILRDHSAGQLAFCPLWIAKPWPIDLNKPVMLDGAPGYYPTTIPQFGDRTNWLLYQYQGDGLGMPGFSPGAVDMNRVNLVKRGAKGTIVMWIQARLGGLTIDGDFGPATEAKVKEVQAAYELVADGIVGTDTFALLTWLTPAPL